MNMTSNSDIHQLNLKVETHKQLKRAKIYTMVDLFVYYPDRLQNIKGIGPIKERDIHRNVERWQRKKRKERE